MGNDTANAPGEIGNPFGVSQFHQTVFLNRNADSYSGPFTIDIYDTSGVPVLHIAGVVSATPHHGKHTGQCFLLRPINPVSEIALSC